LEWGAKTDEMIEIRNLQGNNVDLYPDTSYDTVASWANGEGLEFVSREVYLRNYAGVQAQLIAAQSLQDVLPQPKTYFVLHLRRTDRGNGDDENQIKRLIRSIDPSLPWYVISDAPDAAEKARAWLQRMGRTVISGLPTHEVSGDPNTIATMLDFFLIQRAKGVVASTRIGQSSSFANVAAFSGGAPVLLPFISTPSNDPYLWRSIVGGPLPLLVEDDVDRFNRLISYLEDEDGE
jgi:hypothetical protein